MKTNVIFFDTYAFFEIIRGNPSYEKYKHMTILTTVFNLVELNYGLKRQKGRQIADRYLDLYESHTVPITSGDIKQATELKLRKKVMSFADVIGYVMARKYGVKFLTGDEDFRGMKNVEFVK
ncbi:MAG: PIN domain-containing protein [Candidatus Aenigmarchaeota archaeon]|nr:PIN domain-containing protein [Candidatus Aenigmarchaeota archaeon]